MKREYTSYIISLFLVILSISTAHATHNRAGEITMKKISGLTYEITITTFTYSESPANVYRDLLTVDWGDNTESQAIRIDTMQLLNYYQRNVYVTRHTYPGPGTYSIVVEDPNRNFGVKNIPNSVNVIFSVKTIISISPELGDNSTPVLLNYPIDQAALNQTFIHNPAAFDYEGDSLSYSLTKCTKENGEIIEDYEFPTASNKLYVDSITGDLVWDAPTETGIYNIAMNISEWRQGVKIGNIARDMQIEVYETTNNAPVNDPLPDLCVLAGTVVQLALRATDSDSDNLTQLVTGGPFVFNDGSVSTELITQVPGEINQLFTWNTSCLHPRNQPYSVIIKTEDHNAEINLVDIDNFNIKVLGPPPSLPVLIPSSTSVNILWNKYECSGILGYKIYRSSESIEYFPDSCSPGLPSSSGYELIGSTNSETDTLFEDRNDGKGLLQGIEYCYRITAILKDGSESFPSEENCTNLTSGLPSLLQTSVTNYGINGEILISWAKLKGMDTIPDSEPYTYKIYRSEDYWGNDLELIDSYTTSDLNDTTYTDSNLNTFLYPYSYSVELYINGALDPFGKAEIASTIFPEIKENDNELELSFRRNVPWLNTNYNIYRYNNVLESFEYLASTSETSYIDKNLKNLNSYCYYVESDSKRYLNDTEYLSDNISHQNCGIPEDKDPPCPPFLEVESECDSMFNLLTWFYGSESEECSVDVVSYRIYYRPDLSLEFILLDSLEGRNNTSYIHYPELGLAAQYYVSAIDSFGNESNSLVVTADNCISYAVPNVFTPNNDSHNDILKPYEYRDVQEIDMKIFNRWGQLVFETKNPDILWNGKHKDSNDLVSPGVYYYICDVYEKRISGIEIRNIVGFIHIYHEKGATNYDEVEF